jgi:hypothetical protein
MCVWRYRQLFANSGVQNFERLPSGIPEGTIC